LFARKISVEYEEDGQRQPAPIKWLDSFAMRSFTNDQVFDDTLPVRDGLIEIGAKVPLELLRERMEDWFRRKSYLPKEARLVVNENAAAAGERDPSLRSG
jgi:hypothetical protein